MRKLHLLTGLALGAWLVFVPVDLSHAQSGGLGGAAARGEYGHFSTPSGFGTQGTGGRTGRTYGDIIGGVPRSAEGSIAEQRFNRERRFNEERALNSAYYYGGGYYPGYYGGYGYYRPNYYFVPGYGWGDYPVSGEYAPPPPDVPVDGYASGYTGPGGWPRVRVPRRGSMVKKFIYSSPTQSQRQAQYDQDRQTMKELQRERMQMSEEERQSLDRATNYVDATRGMDDE